ncbi:MAG: SprT-like domain-containing protein [Lachnospiraceae bacterium]|nr:SprT-like domain-containing protein [Lachnospiraceae bacterium]
MTINGIWNEESIRQELRRLDHITGLHGAELPITFGKARSQLGSFHIDPKKRKPKKFHFSLFYFANPEWSRESALETIQHEYAHYMDYILYGQSGHGTTWRMCCRKTQDVEKELNVKGLSRILIINHFQQVIF